MKLNHRGMRYLLTAIFLGGFFICSSQGAWEWTVLPDMPTPVSNNAVTQGYSGDSLCIYSFTGIDSTKTPAGIHLKSWRYNTVSEIWSTLPDVPDVQGKIAASASTINNLIYVVGGYYVNEDFSETSSDDIHIFDPETNSWLADGAQLTTSIDDHVFDVWRDSLLYVITGWHDFNNVRKVQIYDPTTDSWQEGNDLPITNSYPVFGGSGSIIGDTIFYIGGVNNSFNTMSRLRKGVINPEDPTDIEWSVIGECPSGDVYRAAAMSSTDRVFFVGGSSDGYNFDGVSYSSGMGVPVENRILSYLPQWEYWETDIDSPFGQMDLRGIAKAGLNTWIICGGMENDQSVSSNVYKIEYNPSLSISQNKEHSYYIHLENQNLVYDLPKRATQLIIHNTLGEKMNSYSLTNDHTISLDRTWSTGTYLVTAMDNSGSILFSTKLFYSK